MRARSGTRAGMRGAAAATMRGATVATAATLGLCVAGPANAAPAQSPVAKLVNQIANIDQNLSDLASDVAAKRENVNRTLVDYQNAVAAQRLAGVANTAAHSNLDKINSEVVSAQKRFDEFVRAMAQQGGPEGSLSQYVGADNPDEVLDQLSSAERVSREQQAVIRKLQVARNQQANRVAATEAAKQRTDAAAVGAQNRRTAAVEAAEDARTALNNQQLKRNELSKQRNDAVTQLRKLKKQASSENDGGAAVDKLLKALPTNPVAGDDALQQAGEAIAKLALDTGQKLLSSIIGQQQIPQSKLLEELGISGSSPGDLGSSGTLQKLGNGSLSMFMGGSSGGLARPGLRGPQAVELVVNRAKSQLGVPYAWGGGDANGPTLGIRDGGVADSYGDYNKIGFDCSGLMIYAFAGVGIELPHYTGYQYTSGPQYPLAQMQRGDMIFYGANASEHVAMYLGDGTMIEAPESGSVVKISPVRTAGAMPYVVRLT